MRGAIGVEVEAWVHPSGRSIQRNVSTWGEKDQPKSAPPPVPEPEPPEELPPFVDDEGAEALDALDRMSDENNRMTDLMQQSPLD